MKFNQSSNIVITIEDTAFEGVKRIAKKVGQDFNRILGIEPKFTSQLESNIVFATLGKSGFVDELIASGKFNADVISGKREVYATQFIDGQLFIIGSDKRGTIYGMFNLSEYIGVSPLLYWGDVEPVKKDEIVIGSDIEVVSKEPSVKYRGLFINDEWPCYGNWTFNHFGGFTAEMYDNVFELILRLKGNYLWPAMWTSSFPIDGPGSLNEELADIYGVVMGASHHEPCLRASEEWNKVRGPESPYGNNWCYFRNKEGLNKYWEDGIKRSARYENIPMLGMRGEADSEILGKDATLEDNINLLKDVILNQLDLLEKYGNPENPNMLAIYKEVEAFFYGDETTQGLKDWAPLNDAILMFCEDNFGFVRTLPTKELGDRRYGMYYHFDYHGGPISYEWMPSTSYERTWEQMSTAYDHGIRDVWIVNCGDLKFNEVPLQYFMDLAYDFEQWGTKAPNTIKKYTDMWSSKTFPSVDEVTQVEIGEVLQSYIRTNAMRRPEALNASIYHPTHYNEADNMLEKIAKLKDKSDSIYEKLDPVVRDAYYSTIGLPVDASVNLQRMHLYSAKNKHYAEQGKKVANDYADLVTACIERDRQIFADFAEFKNGKWRGMELEEHIGFTTWNDDGWKYPLRYTVEPVHKPRLLVSRKDDARVYHKAYGSPMTVVVDDFLWAGNSQVVIELANDGEGILDFHIEGTVPDWLQLNFTSGSIQAQLDLILTCDRNKLSSELVETRLLIKALDSTVAIDIKALADKADVPSGTYLPNNGVVVIPADGFVKKENAQSAEFVRLENYGRSGVGMKVYPTVLNFEVDEISPKLTYRFDAFVKSDYVVEVWTTPTNPWRNDTPLRFKFSQNGSEEQVLTMVEKDFLPYTSDARWNKGVLDNIRKTKIVSSFEKGVNEITIGALEAGLIIEKLVIYPLNTDGTSLLKPSYLGPKTSSVVK